MKLARTKTPQKKVDLEGIIRPYFEKYGVTLLTSIYINNVQKLEFICKCGNTHFITSASCKIGSIPQCKFCTNKLKSKKQWLRLSREEVEKWLDERGSKLLQYENSFSRFVFQCVICGKLETHSAFTIFKRSIKGGIPKCKQCVYDARRGSKNNNWNPNLTDADRRSLKYGRGLNIKDGVERSLEQQILLVAYVMLEVKN